MDVNRPTIHIVNRQPFVPSVMDPIIAKASSSSSSCCCWWRQLLRRLFLRLYLSCWVHCGRRGVVCLSIWRYKMSRHAGIVKESKGDHRYLWHGYNRMIQSEYINWQSARRNSQECQRKGDKATKKSWNSSVAIFIWQLATHGWWLPKGFAIFLLYFSRV